MNGFPEDKFIATLKPGDYFGEQSLLRNAPRNASVAAKTDVRLACLDSAKFKALKLGEKLSFAKRKAIQTIDHEHDVQRGGTGEEAINTPFCPFRGEISHLCFTGSRKYF